MGASLGPEFAQCAGSRAEATIGTRARKLVEESLERCGSAGPLDRFDLQTRCGKNLANFIYLQKPVVTHSISVSSGGIIQFDVPSANAQKVELPDLGHGSFICTKAGTSEYIMALGSKETNLSRTLRKYDSLEAMVEKVYEFLRAGAESVEVTLGQEMLTAEYDMAAILSELEKSGDTISIASSKRAWIITSYTWMVVVSYKFVPVPDPLKKYVQRLSEKKQSKDMLLREMQTRGAFQQEDIDLFRKFATEDDRITAAEQYMHIMVDQTDKRRFTLEWFEDRFDDHASVDTDGMPAPRQPTAAMSKAKSVDACIKFMVDELRQESVKMDQWHFMIGWEPLQVRDVEEAMHEALRHAANGDHMSFVRFALKAATMAGDTATSPQRIPRGISMGLSEQQKDSIIAAGKSMTDNMIERFERNELPRHRFEDKFADICDTMVHTIQTKILPYGTGPEHLAMCNRQMGDYLRYVYVYVPKRRANDKLIMETYMRAQESASKARPRGLPGVSSFVNSAVFYAEVYRDPARAAETCRKHFEHGLRYYRGSAQENGIQHGINPSEVFNWSLLQNNLIAFETRFVLLKVTFHLDHWTAYRDLVVKCGCFNKGPDKTRKEQPGRAEEPELSPEAEVAEASAEDEWPPFMKSTAENWKLLKGATTEKARHCFESLQGAVSPHDLPADPGTSTAASNTGLSDGFSPQNSPRGNMQTSRHGPSEMPMTAEAYADLATVERWLASRPLSRRHGEGDSEEEEEEEGEEAVQGTNDMPAFRQVRWVDHVEFLDPSVEVDPAVLAAMGNGLTRKKELWQAEVRKVQALAAFRRLSKSAPSSRAFLVGCVVRLSPAALAFASKGKERDTWLGELSKELRAWPGSASLEPKEMEVYLQYELLSILEKLDGYGMVKDQSTVGTARPVTLNPGDILLEPEGKQDVDGLQRYIKDLKSKTLPVTLRFQPCLQVVEAKCLEEGPYMDHHLRFEGFCDANNLQTSSQFTSLESMVKELRSMRHIASKNQSARPTPRRIRDLSARRSAIQAATRGCK